MLKPSYRTCSFLIPRIFFYDVFEWFKPHRQMFKPSVDIWNVNSSKLQEDNITDLRFTHGFLFQGKMSKQYKLFTPGPVGRPPIDWDHRVLRQRTTSEKLVRPWQGHGELAGAGYESLAKNINKFHELGEVPLNVNPELLNDGSGIAETLQKIMQCGMPIARIVSVT